MKNLVENEDGLSNDERIKSSNANPENDKDNNDNMPEQIDLVLLD